MTGSVMERIEAKRSSFSKGHRRIAAYITEHYDEAAFMTAARLGSITGVSEPTVVRFATALGYDGYPEFIKELGEYTKARMTAVQRVGVSSKLIGEDDVLSRIMSMDAECVKKSIGIVSRTDFNASVDAIANAENIYLLGVRSASTLASFMNCYLSMIYKHVMLINTLSASEMFEQLHKIDKNDVIVGISFPRYSQRTVKALKYARARGAKVIAITDSEQAPIVRYSDFKLLAKCEIMSYVDSLVAPLSVINALLVALSMREKDELDRTLTELEHIWDEYDVYEKNPSNEQL